MIVSQVHFEYHYIRQEGLYMTIPNSWFLYIDIAIVIFYIFMLFYGGKKGFMEQLLSLCGTIVALAFDWFLYPIAAERFQLWPESIHLIEVTVLDKLFQQYLNEICWFILLFIAFKLLFLLLKPFTDLICKLPLFKEVNSLLGVVFSFITATIWCLILCLILQLPLFTNGKELIASTLLKYPELAGSLVVKDLKKNEETIAQIISMSSDWDNITEEERDVIRKWLSDNHLDEKDIDKLMNPDKEEESASETETEPAASPETEEKKGEDQDTKTEEVKDE